MRGYDASIAPQHIQVNKAFAFVGSGQKLMPAWLTPIRVSLKAGILAKKRVFRSICGIENYS
jgi:hypothetical protein